MANDVAPGRAPAFLPHVVMGVPFAPVTAAQALDWCVTCIRTRRPVHLASAGLDFLRQAEHDDELRRALLQADMMVASGGAVSWLARRMGPALPGCPPSRALLADLLAGFARENMSVYLLGANAEVERLATYLARAYPGLKVAGRQGLATTDLLEMDHTDVLRRLREARPDVLLAALGRARQDKFIRMHARNWDVPLALGVGAAEDSMLLPAGDAPGRAGGAAIRFFSGAVCSLLRLRLRAPGWGAVVPWSDAWSEMNAVPATWPGGTEDAELRAWVERTDAAAGRRSVVCDVQSAAWLDSRQLGALFQLARNRRAAGALMLVSGVSRRVRALLEFNRLTDWIVPAADGAAVAERLSDWARERGRTEIQASGYRMTIRLPAELHAGNLEEFKAQALAQLDPFPSVLSYVELDAAQLVFVDSSALGFWMGLKCRAAEAGAQLRIRNLSGAPRRTLRLARLDSLLADPD